jgi:excisionase family DNA binding protein
VRVVGGGVEVADHDEPLRVDPLADPDVLDLERLVHGTVVGVCETRANSWPPSRNMTCPCLPVPPWSLAWDRDGPEGTHRLVQPARRRHNPFHRGGLPADSPDHQEDRDERDPHPDRHDAARHDDHHRGAELLGISRSAAYRAVARGEIPTIRIGRRLLVPTAKLYAMLGWTTGPTE